MPVFAPLRRFARWGEAHPWLHLGLAALLGLALLLLVPPRDSVPFAALKIGAWVACYLAMNLVRYRALWPSRARVEAAEAEADRIAAAVRRTRGRDATR